MFLVSAFSREHTYKHIICLLSITADVDYVSLVRNITFKSGEDTKTFSVDLIDDNIDENDEQFAVVLKPIPDSPYDVMIPVLSSFDFGIILDDDMP